MMSINKKLRTLLIVCLAVILGVVLFNIVHLFSHSVEEYIMNARVEGMSLEELENELGQSGIYGRTYEEGFVIYAKSGECPFYQGKMDINSGLGSMYKQKYSKTTNIYSKKLIKL